MIQALEVVDSHRVVMNCTYLGQLLEWLFLRGGPVPPLVANCDAFAAGGSPSDLIQGNGGKSRAVSTGEFWKP
jgi:hypothetical protein